MQGLPGRPHHPKADIDKFLAESGRAMFTYRMVIATTDKFHHVARRTMRTRMSSSSIGRRCSPPTPISTGRIPPTTFARRNKLNSPARATISVKRSRT